MDKLTKYAYFVLYKGTLTVEQLGFLVLDRLIRYYKIPRKLISDRDKLFISAY